MQGPLPPREVVVPDDAMVPRAVSSLIDGTSSPSNLFSSAKLTLWSYSRKAVVLILSCSFFPPLLNSVTVEGASSAPRRGRAAPPPLPMSVQRRLKYNVLIEHSIPIFPPLKRSRRSGS